MVRKLNIRTGVAEKTLEQALNTGDYMQAQKQAFQSIALALDETLNGELRGDEREIGFMLIAFPFHNPGQGGSFVSNSDANFIEFLELQLAMLKLKKKEQEE